MARFSKKIEVRLDNLAAAGFAAGYGVTDEGNAYSRTLVFRQARDAYTSDTELRLTAILVESTGRVRMEARGWHNLDATGAGKKVAVSAVAMWLQRHAVCR